MDDVETYKRISTDTGVMTLTRYALWYDEIALIAQATGVAWLVVGDGGSVFLHTSPQPPELSIYQQEDNTIHGWSRNRDTNSQVIRLGKLRNCHFEKYHLYQIMMDDAKSEILA